MPTAATRQSSLTGVHPRWEGHYFEMPAKQLILLEVNSAIFSKRTLKSLNNQAGFDSAILRFAQATRWCSGSKLLRSAPIVRLKRAFGKASGSPAISLVLACASMDLSRAFGTEISLELPTRRHIAILQPTRKTPLAKRRIE